ncbi:MULTISPECIES: CheW domain-containing protein [Pseudomonas]|uniref:CheW domain protein n=1 Tax=Pseudomonas chlororaphis subsp. aureofaciens TaxID=587851 RepID=A0AAD0ZCL3_9PSED|nr:MULTISPECIES: CheW domain-containing protein [Pseudomonas]AIC18816.1 chemotaxis protein CheW [Pseudomonas chlororaphis]AZE28492.1 CheW domain protein [Pseudomonas chlororaphis subsp. aureofaciens]AZE34737.1 CheW domain protein [Pseudomonas chlororaphis subsp. aureofaciens]AZE41071.1 CheW domain protein [Pseudomonas chlororaphis subsp. aureofaciens]QHC88344.1 chemotaxis protein CheW [Pseudomonas chlororaphis]
MNRPVDVTSRPQLALQSYLDALLQDATEEEFAVPEALPQVQAAVEEVAVSSEVLDEFQAAVLEEQARDARVQRTPPAAAVVAPVAPVEESVVAPVLEAPAPLPATLSTVVPLLQGLVEPVVEVHRPPSSTPPPVAGDDRPSWAAEPFECLLFDVAGLTLAVPLVCLGSIYSLAGHELTPLFGQPEWFLGILPSQAGNLKVLDTARWVMPDRYRDDFRQGLQYVISVQGYEWGLAVHQVSRSLRLDPNEIKWRSHRGQRPWLAGTVIEHMCALLDVSELAELIASGGAKHMAISKPAPKPI